MTGRHYKPTKDTLRVAVSCNGKEQMSFERARKVAKAINRQDAHALLNAYRCMVCGWWHVGSHDKQHDRRKDQKWEQHTRRSGEQW